MTITPDVEAIVGNYLRTHADVEAIVGDRVMSRTPDGLDQPWVRFTQLTDVTGWPLHVVIVHLQLDCYAGADNDRACASLLARTVRAALNALPAAGVAGAVVSKVSFSGLRPMPDTDVSPARERFLFFAQITVHP